MMKKVILFIGIFLITFTNFGQYRKWAIGGEFGAHSVSDESAIATDPYNHWGVDVRYNVNEIVGVGLEYGKDNLALESVTGERSNLDFTRVHAKATLSVFELLRLPHRNFNVLFNGGPGVSRTNYNDTGSDYDQYMFSVSGGVAAIVRLNSFLAAKLAYTSTAQFSQDRTLDNIYDLSTAGVSSVVDNATVGLIFHPRTKKNKEFVHADWYSPAPVVPVVNNITEVTEVREITNEVAVPAECNCKIREFVFFDHDKYNVREEALNAITKVYTYLSENEDAVLKIYGFASPTQSSAEYNKELSRKRGNEIKVRLGEMGISPDRVVVVPEGKDYKLTKEMMHDIARRVELIVE